MILQRGIRRNSAQIRFIAPFILFFVIFGIYHAFLQVGFYDDENIKNILQQYTIWEYLKQTYLLWSSRIICSFFCVLIGSFPFWVWKVSNVLIAVAMAITVSKLCNNEHATQYFYWVVCSLMLMYPWTDMATAGWISTTTNYFWILFFLLFSMLSIKKRILRNKIKWWEYPLYTASLIAGCGHEQAALLAVGVYALFLLHCLMSNRPWKFSLFQFLICLGSILFILTCPGNNNRGIQEVAAWFPDYELLSLTQKIDIGLSRTVYSMFFKPNILVLTCCFFTTIIIFFQYKDKLYRALSIVPLFVVMFFGILSPMTQNVFPSLFELRNQLEWRSVETVVHLNHGIINFTNFTSVQSYLALIVLLVALGCMILSIAIAFKNSCEGVYLCTFMIFAIIATTALGLSPTVWISRERTLILIYAALILLASMLYSKICLLHIRCQKIVCFTTVFISFLCFANTICTKYI